MDDEDLEGIKADEINDYVWDELGGKDVAHDICEMWLERVEE